MASEESGVAVGGPARSSHPISWSVVYPERLSRSKGAKRAVGALVGWIVPAGLGYISAVIYLWTAVIIVSLIVVGVISVPLVLAVRIRSRGLRRYQGEDGPSLERFAGRAMAWAAYSLFLTDEPPKQAVGRSVRLEIARGGEFGWVRAAVSPVLLLPHIALLSVLAFAFMVIIPACVVAAVGFQRYPRWFFGFTVGYLRWIARALAYWLSLTDRYPPFSFAEGA